MKFFLFLVVFLSFYLISSLYILEEDGSLEPDLNTLKYKKTTSSELDKIYNKFSDLNVDSKNINLEKMITDIKKARNLYPLDDKLKMIDIELEHKKASQLNTNKVSFDK